MLKIISETAVMLLLFIVFIIVLAAFEGCESTPQKHVYTTITVKGDTVYYEKRKARPSSTVGLLSIVTYSDSVKTVRIK